MTTPRGAGAPRGVGVARGANSRATASEQAGSERPARRRRLALLARGPGDDQRDHDRGEDQPGADQVGEVVAAVERGGDRARRRRGGSRSRSTTASPGRRGRARRRPAAVVLTRPEARPASSGVAPDIASVISDGKRDRGAGAEQQHDRQDVGHVAAVDRRAGEQEQARRRSSARPGTQRRAGAEAGDQPLGVAQRQRAHDDRRRAGTRGRSGARRSPARAAGRGRP